MNIFRYPRQGNSTTADQSRSTTLAVDTGTLDLTRLRGPAPRVVLCFRNSVLDKYDVLPQRVLRIGRSHDNEIPVQDHTVSRHHADVLRAPNGEAVIRDKGSTNGTFVNGRQTHQAILREGDVVQIGRHRLFFITPIENAAMTARRPVVVQHPSSHAAVPARSADRPVPAAATAPPADTADDACDAWLEIVQGDGGRKRQPLTRRVTPIGNDDCRQAAIRQWSGGYMVSPLWGDEYPIVNGDRVISGHRNLVDGDVIEFSGQRLVFRETGD